MSGPSPTTPWTRWLLPAQSAPLRRDVLRSGVGGLLGILVTGLVGVLAIGEVGDLPWIVAPMGASAVLLYAVPASPLAQPWSVIGGNTVSALVGLAGARFIGWAPLSVAAAVGAAVSLMALLRCLHPPGGACALTAALAPASIVDRGFTFAFWPVGLGSVVMVVTAIAFHSLGGRRYPHVTTVAPDSPASAAGVDAGDVAAAMARLDQGIDIAPADVVALIRDAEARVLQRRIGGLTCRDLMVTDVATVNAHESLYRVRLLIEQRRVKALPVVDDDRRVIGILSIVDVFNQDPADLSTVESLMVTDVETLSADAPVTDLVDLMVHRGRRHVPVVEDDGLLVGLVTRAELIEVLHRLLLEEGLDQGQRPSEA
ncbi:MAG: HPP family protein [Acidimicrobiales bacterium]|nr:HPP family protein [Acidimicrobiales bacterium]